MLPQSLVAMPSPEGTSTPHPGLQGCQIHPLVPPLPLHILLSLFNLGPSTIETISPIRHHPNWSLLVTMHIAAGKKETISHIRTRIDNVSIYTDRPGYKDHIRA